MKNGEATREKMADDGGQVWKDHKEWGQRSQTANYLYLHFVGLSVQIMTVKWAEWNLIGDHFV